MSVTHAGSQRSRAKAVGAFLWLSALMAGPALAANYYATDCDAALPGPSDNLNARVASGHDLDSHPDTRVLNTPRSDTPASPRIEPTQANEEALIVLAESPAAFAESSVDTSNDLMPNLQSESDDSEDFNASIPGVSDDELQRYKRQMYRKDI